MMNAQDILAADAAYSAELKRLKIRDAAAILVLAAVQIAAFLLLYLSKGA